MKLAEAFKLFGNSAYGKLIEALKTQTTVKEQMEGTRSWAVQTEVRGHSHDRSSRKESLRRGRQRKG